MRFEYFQEHISWEETLKDETFLEIYDTYLSAHRAGGCLHIVLSDNNIEDKDIENCFYYAEKQGDVAAMYIAKKLYAVSYEDREKYLFMII